MIRILFVIAAMLLLVHPAWSFSHKTYFVGPDSSTHQLEMEDGTSESVFITPWNCTMTLRHGGGASMVCNDGNIQKHYQGMTRATVRCLNSPLVVEWKFDNAPPLIAKIDDSANSC